jgi:hypothetical protein
MYPSDACPGPCELIVTFEPVQVRMFGTAARPSPAIYCRVAEHRHLRPFRRTTIDPEIVNWVNAFAQPCSSQCDAGLQLNGNA